MTDTTELEARRETVLQRWQTLEDKHGEQAIELVRQYEELSDRIRWANWVPFTKVQKEKENNALRRKNNG